MIIITPEIEKKIKNLKEFAFNNIFETDDLKNIIEKGLPAVGDDERFVVYIQQKYRVTFSIEQQIDGNLYRHISISYNDMTSKPSIPAVNFIMELFEMKPLQMHDLITKKTFIYFEHDDMVPNILQKMNHMNRSYDLKK